MAVHIAYYIKYIQPANTMIADNIQIVAIDRAIVRSGLAKQCQLADFYRGSDVADVKNLKRLSLLDDVGIVTVYLYIF